MKNKKLLLFVFGLIMTTQMIFSQVPSYVPTNGLIGYWPFNGNANDQSVSGNNGTVNGATLTSDRFGNTNSAYNFDGIDDNILYQMNSNIAPSSYNNYSVSFWLNWADNQNSGRILQFFEGFTGNTTNYDIVVNESNRPQGTLSVVHYLGFNTTSSPTVLNTDVWKFCVIVFNHTNDTFDFFINGNLWFSGNLGSNHPNAGLLSVGSQINNFSAFKGKIDDIGIWNRALTQQEITTMFNGVNYSDTCNAVSGSLVNGLVGYWPFCGNANDQSGNGNNGTVNGATLTSDRFGNVNSAYDFDGNLYTHINVPLQETLQSNKSFSCWIKLPFNFINPYCHLITAKNQTVVLPNDYLSINGNHPFYVSANNVGRFFDGKTGIGLNSTINFNNNIWHHIVLTHDYNLQQAKLFIDGVLIETLNSSSFSTNSLIDRFVFGGDLNTNTSANATLFGQLDDIGIWNRALTQQEVTQLYNQNQCTTNITVTDTLIINVGQLSYTNPVTYANNITIYPNPANTQVNISFNNITDLTGGNINIINSLGQQVATTPITATGTNTTMPLNTWGGTGLYFVQILNAQGIVVDVKKIILQ